MFSQANGPSVGEWDAPRVPKPTGHRRWSISRLATDLAIVAIAVPFGLRFLAPPVRGECGTTLDNFALMAGLWFLAAKMTWIPLKALNDAAERWLASSEHRSSAKPKPQDDF